MAGTIPCLRHGVRCGSMSPEASSYASVYRRSLEDREAFWGEAAEALHWFEPWRRVLDDSRAPFHRWFEGGRFNTCYNCLDRHVDSGRGEKAALIYDSP